MNLSITKNTFSNVLRFKIRLLQAKLNATANTKMSQTNDGCSLSALDKEIIRLHAAAVKNNQIFYEDPVTGLLVSTEVKHLKRKKCCGSGCRHVSFYKHVCA